MPLWHRRYQPTLVHARVECPHKSCRALSSLQITLCLSSQAARQSNTGDQKWPNHHLLHKQACQNWITHPQSSCLQWKRWSESGIIPIAVFIMGERNSQVNARSWQNTVTHKWSVTYKYLGLTFHSWGHLTIGLFTLSFQSRHGLWVHGRPVL